MNNTPDKTQAYVKEYIEYIEYQRGYSPQTVEAYGRDLKEFSRYLSRRGIDDPARVGHRDIRAFLGELKERLSRSSINRKLSCLRSLYAYMLGRGYIRSDPSQKVSSSSAPLHYPEVLTGSEVEKMINAPSSNSKLILRDKAL
ncbi:MAG: site-specific integrase, partial [Elusimicrobiota bacterium]